MVLKAFSATLNMCGGRSSPAALPVIYFSKLLNIPRKHKSTLFILRNGVGIIYF